MTKSSAGRRLAVAATVVAAAIGAAAPAHADSSIQADKCEGGAEALEQRFREIEEKRGYDAATKWWYKAWEKYYETCVAP